MATYTDAILRGSGTVTGNASTTLQTIGGTTGILISSFRATLKMTAFSGTPTITITCGTSGANLFTLFTWLPSANNKTLPDKFFLSSDLAYANMGLGMIDLLECKTSTPFNSAASYTSQSALGPHNSMGLLTGDTIKLVCDTTSNTCAIQYDILGATF